MEQEPETITFGDVIVAYQGNTNLCEQAPVCEFIEIPEDELTPDEQLL